MLVGIGDALNNLATRQQLSSHALGIVDACSFPTNEARCPLGPLTMRGKLWTGDRLPGRTMTGTLLRKRSAWATTE